MAFDAPSPIVIRRQTSICADFCRVDTLEKSNKGTLKNSSRQVATNLTR